MKTMSGVIFAVAALAATVLAGCNTVEGFGRDVSAGGKVISDTADKTQRAITQ